MKNPDDFFSKLELPVFILFRNLRFEHDFDIDAPIARGEIIASGSIYEELHKKLSKPAFPVDEYKQSLLDTKYGNIAESELEYDDTIFDITEANPSDYEIFGESFTIVFFCPSDKNKIVKFLVNDFIKHRNLIDIWSKYIDRIRVFPFYSLEASSDDFYDEVTADFEETVSALEQPPSTEDWDELDDYLK
jgi:hypothetical protein